jgi:uncharacterized protein (TIGR02266 family)
MTRSSRPPEQRRPRADRYAIKVPVDYSSVDAFFTDFSANLNGGGMFVETESAAEPGQVVQLQFKLPGREDPLRVSARVAWVSDGKAESPPGMGVEFQDLSEETREAINDIVRSLRV